VAAASAARRYARALFALAREEGRVAQTRDELAAIEELLAAHPELRAALFRPLHPAAERKAALGLLSARLGTGATVQRFLQFLIDQRRLVDYAAIRTEYGRLADAAAGRLRAEVVSAAPLSEREVARLREALARRSGREVALETRVDASLLGGVVAKLGDLLFDGSLRTQLRQLRASLSKET
jgi:F-type H+-transporting ATPase subunit delta